MARWVLECSGCETEFTHSEIYDDETVPPFINATSYSIGQLNPSSALSHVAMIFWCEVSRTPLESCQRAAVTLVYGL